MLLFDNADDFGYVIDVLPGPQAACHIIITTRKAQTHDIFYQRNVNLLLLSVLEKRKAVVALLSWAGKSKDTWQTLDYNEKKYAEKVAAEPPVDGLPLALSHAGAFIEQHRITFLKYWRKIEAESKRLEAAALNLDSFLRYFHLSHLKEDLVTFSVHHLIQASVLQRMVGSTDDFVSVLKFAAKALFERLPHVNDLSNYLISPMVLSLTPHIYSTVEKMLRMGILDEEVDPGLVDCGCQLALSYRHYDEAGFLCSLRVKAFEANSTTISDEETSLRKRNCK